MHDTSTMQSACPLLTAPFSFSPISHPTPPYPPHHPIATPTPAHLPPHPRTNQYCFYSTRTSLCNSPKPRQWRCQNNFLRTQVCRWVSTTWLKSTLSLYWRQHTGRPERKKVHMDGRRRSRLERKWASLWRWWRSSLHFIPAGCGWEYVRVLCYGRIVIVMDVHNIQSFHKGGDYGNQCNWMVTLIDYIFIPLVLWAIVHAHALWILMVSKYNQPRWPSNWTFHCHCVMWLKASL